MSVTINSVVLLGITNHYTRNHIQKQKGNQKRVVGGLMGRQNGGQITVNSIFEIAYELDNNGEITSIDQQHLEQKVKLIKYKNPFNHFQDDEFVGWYSTTPNGMFQKQDLNVHEKVSQSMNALLAGDEGENSGDKGSDELLYMCLTLDDKIIKNPNQKEVPLNLYRTTTKKEQKVWEQVQHVVNAEKGEIISIESSSQSYGAGKSQFAGKMQTTLNAVNRYNEKIEGLLQAIENPAVGKNLILMRELKSILNSFPEQNSGFLDSAMLEQYSDANIQSFLSAISASNRVVQDVYQSNSNLKSAQTQNNHQSRRNEMFM